jgi:hypothetical protein
MELLRSASAPFVIAALLSVLGWHIGTLTEEIRETRSVVYEVVDLGEGDTITAVVTNVSKSEMLVGAKFALVCKDVKRCLDYETKGVELFPPTADDSISLDGNDRILAFTVDLAAGGRIGVSAKRRTADQVSFYFFPQKLPFEDDEPADDEAASAPDGSTEPGSEMSAAEAVDEAGSAAAAGETEAVAESNTKDIFVLDGDTWRGWVVLNYFDIVLTSFFLVLVALIFGIVSLGSRRSDSPRVEDNVRDPGDVTPGSGEAS